MVLALGLWRKSLDGYPWGHAPLADVIHRRSCLPLFIILIIIFIIIIMIVSCHFLHLSHLSWALVLAVRSHWLANDAAALRTPVIPRNEEGGFNKT